MFKFVAGYHGYLIAMIACRLW